ncbi:MAG: ATP-binding protein [Proteobacteria bacterium]|nr:ATP-binding protein [Pseudomonadota bacterium]
MFAIKPTIKLKVLLVLLLFTIVVVISMAVTLHYGFDRGFIKYRQSIENKFNTKLVKALENHYKESESWGRLRSNHALWKEIVFSSLELADYNKNTAKPTNHNKKHQHKKKKRTKQQLHYILPNTSVFDKYKKVVIGPKKHIGQKRKYIKIYSDGQYVGFLAVVKNDKIYDELDNQFGENIERMLIKMAALMLLTALLITLPIAKYFSKTVKKITAATQKVAAGDFSVRIDSKRKDELGQLAKNFNHLAKTLESNAQTQKTMMADIAHELRTPVSVILGEIEAIQDGVHQADEKRFGLLHSQISSLKNLINDLHQLSQSDLGGLKYKLEKTDLNDLLEQSYQSFKLKFEQKNMVFKWQPAEKPCFIMGDKNRLNQLFNNLLDNSVRYTEQGGETSITLEKTDQLCRITICDSKPGLSQKQLEKIFDRLYRAEGSRNKKTGGAGLGLSICKKIVEAHSGKIFAQQASLGGVKIVVELPEY